MARNTSRAVQQYRGTTLQHSTYTGLVGELTVDTDKNVVVVQDGQTAGGHPMVKETRRITGDNTIVKINNGPAANLAQDVAVSIDVTGMATALVSAEANNGLSVDQTGKLYATAAKADLIIKPGDKILTDDNGKLSATVSLAYNTTSGKLDILGHDGVSVVGTVTIPSSTSMLTNVELTKNNAEQPTVTNKTWLKFTFKLADNNTKDLYVDVTDLIDIYEGGDAITITGKTVDVKVQAGNGLVKEATGLRVDAAGAISADAGNILSAGSDNKLLAKPVSTGAGNLATAGTDGGVMVTKAGIKAPVIEIVKEGMDDVDDPLAESMISATAGNALRKDNTDKKLYVPLDYGTMG